MKSRGILFYDPARVELTLLEGERYNLPMYAKNINLFRGIDNTVEFSIKDSDQQPYTGYANNFLCVITNLYQPGLTLTKYLYELDPGNGIYSLTLTCGELQKWSTGAYNYSVIMQNVDGTQNILYTTLDQEITGVFDLIDQPYPIQQYSYYIGSTVPPTTPPNSTAKDWTMVLYNPIASPPVTDFISSSFAGNGQKNINDALSSFTLNLNNFTGTFWLQATLDYTPQTDADWFNVPIDPLNPNNNFINFTADSDLHVYSFQGNFIWIRFRYEVTSMSPGSINRIWLKV